MKQATYTYFDMTGAQEFWPQVAKRYLARAVDMPTTWYRRKMDRIHMSELSPREEEASLADFAYPDGDDPLIAPEAFTEWMETNVPEGLTVFALPVHQRKRMRTSNILERLNRELKRRTRVATLFPNEASLLRLVSAILVEISEEWETGKIYLRMNQA